MVTGSSTYALLPTLSTPGVTISDPTTTSLQVNFSSSLNCYGVPILRLATNSGMTNIVGQNSGTASQRSYSYTFTGLQPSTLYYAQTEANDGYISMKSSVANLYTLANIPTSLSTSNISAKSLTISFSNNSNGPTTIYEIERSLTGNPSGTDWVNIYTGGSQSFDDSGLDPKTIYYYRVRAKNGNNVYSSYSSILSVQTLEKDTVAPTVSLTINNGNSTLMDDVLPVKAVVGDNRTSNTVLVYSYSVNGKAWTAPASVGQPSGILNLTVAHGLSTSGDLNFQLRVYDDDGNVGIANAKIYYQKPSELPSAPSGESVTAAGAAALSIGTLDSESVYFTAKTSLYLEMSTQTQPYYQVLVNNFGYGSVTPKANKAIIHLGTEGLHSVKVRQVNSVGIPGTEKEYRIVVDKTAPTVTVSFADQRTITSANSITAKVSGSDNISSLLQYRINEGAWDTVPVNGIININLTQGFNKLKVDIADDAGNIASQQLEMWRRA